MAVGWSGRGVGFGIPLGSLKRGRPMSAVAGAAGHCSGKPDGAAALKRLSVMGYRLYNGGVRNGGGGWCRRAGTPK